MLFRGGVPNKILFSA